MIDVVLPDGHVWLRITRPHYTDPFDTSHARRRGARWNPPDSWPTLYLNEDLATVHAQVRHLFVGRGVEPDDLDDDAPIRLAAATLPSRQRVADVVSPAGVAAVGLPEEYPLDGRGRLVSHDVTQAVGAEVHAAGRRGVWCRSASGTGHELAWFPAARSVARPWWPTPLPFGTWRNAVSLEGLAVDING
ncbi:MAG TPA: RES family NAD+ phosphorylase [Ilumatobacteraceae bacterium]|nr:RES family NAD+ phosphorylase [Ilumatobacteraceae bacterium]